MKEFKCDDGHTYICKDNSCLVCNKCSDIFWDYTSGPYMVICSEDHDISKGAQGQCKFYEEEDNE